ncbi:MAG: hypothetical protein QM784_03950 [Polyangiaceae bacterium]
MPRPRRGKRRFLFLFAACTLIPGAATAALQRKSSPKTAPRWRGEGAERKAYLSRRDDTPQPTMTQAETRSKRVVVSVGAPPSDVCVRIDGAASNPVVSRLKSELRLLGVDVRSDDASDNETVCDAVVVSRRRQVIIRLSSEHDGEVVHLPSGDAKRPELVALAAVELLRARILHTNPSSPAAPEHGDRSTTESSTQGRPEPSADSVTTLESDDDGRTTDETARTESEDSARLPWGFAIGPGILASPGGAPVLPVITSSIDVNPSGRLHFALNGLSTYETTVWKVSGGRLELDAQLLGVSCGRSFWLGSKAVALRVGGGVSALRAHYRSVALSPVFVGRDGTRWAALPQVEVSVSWFPLARFGLRLGGFVGVAVPDVLLPHPERELAVGADAAPEETRWARPLGLGTLTLEFRL